MGDRRLAPKCKNRENDRRRYSATTQPVTGPDLDSGIPAEMTNLRVPVHASRRLGQQGGTEDNMVVLG
jgi:hypothetical protein